MGNVQGETAEKAPQKLTPLLVSLARTSEFLGGFDKFEEGLEMFTSLCNLKRERLDMPGLSVPTPGVRGVEASMLGRPRPIQGLHVAMSLAAAPGVGLTALA